MKPLDRIKVLDLTIGQQGPICGVMLADYGADVLKIEPPEKGDYMARGLMKVVGNTGTAVKGMVNFYVENNNRGKKSLTLDVRKPEGKEILFKLVKNADVFMQNFRPGVVDKMGVAYKDISKINPKIVYVSISGLGNKGPEGKKTALDLTAQARSGFMYMHNEPGPPSSLTGGFADQVGGTMTFSAVLLGLLARERMGIGQEIHTSLLGSMIWLQGLTYAMKMMLGIGGLQVPRTEQANPLWNHYMCKDGKWLMMAMLTADTYWPSLCKVMGLENIEKDPRFADMAARATHKIECIKILDDTFKTKTRDEWMEKFSTVDLILDKLQDHDDVIKDPQVIANEYLTEFEHPTVGNLKIIGCPFTLSETPGDPKHPAPEMGQNTEEILLELGYSWDQINKLREEKTI